MKEEGGREGGGSRREGGGKVYIHIYIIYTYIYCV